MRSARLQDMIGGWFVGAFSPTIFKTEGCEVAVKKYSKDDREPAHYHAIATEITVIISGEVLMSGKRWGEGDIVVLDPLDVTDFEALTEVTTVVVKIPGVLNDKYLVQDGK